jgi:predicted  nucleic acid-binding Zn-ribbon protein
LGTEDDIERLRGECQQLGEENKSIRSRLDRLEERFINRDEKIEGLMKDMADLKKQVTEGLTGLSIQIQNLANAPAQKVAGRWDEALKTAITALVGGAVVYALARGGLS